MSYGLLGCLTVSFLKTLSTTTFLGIAAIIFSASHLSLYTILSLLSSISISLQDSLLLMLASIYEKGSCMKFAISLSRFIIS